VRHQDAAYLKRRTRSYHVASPYLVPVFGADLVPGSKLAAIYEPIIVGRPAFISFQTSAELHYGALRRGWGPTRMLKLEARINEAEVKYRLVLASAAEQAPRPRG
jgi:hypothetical protein